MKYLLATILMVAAGAGVIFYALTSIPQDGKINIEFIRNEVEGIKGEIEDLRIKIKDILILGGDQQLAVGGKTYFLSGAGISAIQTTVDLTEFRNAGDTVKLDIDDFGGVRGCGTLEPATKRQEFISFTGVVQNTDGSARLTGVIRGLADVSPYNASTTLQKSHSGGSKFVLSNTPPCFYENLASKQNDDSIRGVWTFFTPPISTTTATSSMQLVNKSYVDSVAISGAATSTFNAQGIVRLATLAEIMQGVGTSTDKGGEPLVIFAGAATSSPTNPAFFSNGGYIPSTNNSGKIDRAFIATSSRYDWTGAHTFSGGVDFLGSSIFSGGIKIASSTASSTPITVDSNGNVRGQGAILFDSGISTRAAGSTGNQTINHNLGRQPYFVEIHQTSISSQVTGSNRCGQLVSFGIASSTNATSQYSAWSSVFSIGSGTGVGYASTTPSSIIYGQTSSGGSGSVEVEARITAITTTSFTINWITNNASDATGCTGSNSQRNILWKVY